MQPLTVRPRALSWLLVLASLAACDGEQRGSGAATGGDAAFRVALLTSGPVSDAGWYAGAYEGLQRIGSELGASITHQQTRTPAEFDEAFTALGADGYDLVFAHGFEYQDAALRAGERFPDMTIVVSGGGRLTRNVIPLIFRLEEGSYLAGLVAGSLTRSGTVGMVGGVEIPPVKGTFDAFRAGAMAARPDVRVIEAFTGDWEDVAAAKEAAVAQLRAGADVLIHNVDAGSFGVFQAVREARSQGRTAWAIGMNRDQNDVAPDVIVGSAVIHIPDAFLEAARRVRSGDPIGAPLDMTIAQGVIDFVFNPERADVIPETLHSAVDAARAGIRSGALRVPRVPFVEGDTGGG
ncbi:MAG: BMP family protein [Gemmatimonadota bacterium]